MFTYLYSTYFQEYVDKIPKGFDEQNRIYGTFPSAGQKAPFPHPRLSEIKKSPPGLGLNIPYVILIF